MDSAAGEDRRDEGGGGARGHGADSDADGAKLHLHPHPPIPTQTHASPSPHTHSHSQSHSLSTHRSLLAPLLSPLGSDKSAPVLTLANAHTNTAAGIPHPHIRHVSASAARPAASLPLPLPLARVDADGDTRENKIARWFAQDTHRQEQDDTCHAQSPESPQSSLSVADSHSHSHASHQIQTPPRHTNITTTTAPLFSLRSPPDSSVPSTLGTPPSDHAHGRTADSARAMDGRDQSPHTPPSRPDSPLTMMPIPPSARTSATTRPHPHPHTPESKSRFPPHLHLQVHTRDGGAGVEPSPSPSPASELSPAPGVAAGTGDARHRDAGWSRTAGQSGAGGWGGRAEDRDARGERMDGVAPRQTLHAGSNNHNHNHPHPARAFTDPMMLSSSAPRLGSEPVFVSRPPNVESNLAPASTSSSPTSPPTSHPAHTGSSISPSPSWSSFRRSRTVRLSRKLSPSSMTRSPHLRASSFTSLPKSPATSFLAAMAEATDPLALSRGARDEHYEGDIVGAYKLGKVIGRGAFSVVVDARVVDSDDNPNRTRDTPSPPAHSPPPHTPSTVAVKVVRKPQPTSEGPSRNPSSATVASPGGPISASASQASLNSPPVYGGSVTSPWRAWGGGASIATPPDKWGGASTTSSTQSLAPATEDQQRQVDWEVDVLRALDHPGVGRVYEVLDTDEATFIVSEALGSTMLDYVEECKRTAREAKARERAGGNANGGGWGAHAANGGWGGSAHGHDDGDDGDVGGLPLAVVQRYFSQLVDTVSYLHDVAGLVHGDIKLENVLLSCDKAFCKLVDFGLARFVDGRGGALADTSGEPAGTLAYLAPELLRRPTGQPSPVAYGSSASMLSPGTPAPRSALVGIKADVVAGVASPASASAAASPHMSPPTPRAAGVSPRSPTSTPSSASPAGPAPATDVWALGVVLYAMLTGSLPFDDVFPPRLQMKIVKGIYDEDALDKVGAGEDVKAVVRGMFRVKREDRVSVAWLKENAWVKAGGGFGSVGGAGTGGVGQVG